MLFYIKCFIFFSMKMRALNESTGSQFILNRLYFYYFFFYWYRVSFLWAFSVYWSFSSRFIKFYFINQLLSQINRAIEYSDVAYTYVFYFKLLSSNVVFQQPALLTFSPPMRIIIFLSTRIFRTVCCRVVSLRYF